MTEQLIWAFDLGKGSLGEVVRCGSEFLHKDSLLIPEDFAETKTAANRRRMWRTREAHHAREEWLDKVMLRSGIEPMKRRKCQKVDGVWLQPQKGDERLEREFPKKGDKTCYTSCLLRIKLLRGEKLEPWQIYKALHSAIQKRGYGKVLWAAKEAARKNTTPEELEKKEQAELEKKDPAYKEAVEAWRKFKLEIKDARLHFPCYYDAAKMGLWNPAQPDILQERIIHNAQSTRRVRFDREDIEKEVMALARQAAKQLPQIQKAFEETKAAGWIQCDGKTGRKKRFSVRAKDFAEFLVYGPAGKPNDEEDFHRYLRFREKQEIHSGSADDWMGVLAQKTPRFDNRIINTCALIPRFHVCKTMLRKDKNNQLVLDSLLAVEVTCLMKLKNLRVERFGQQTQLTADEIGKIFNGLSAKAHKKAEETSSNDPKWNEKVANCYKITENEWKKKCERDIHAQPLSGHCEIEAPRASERSRFSRPALRILKKLILSGKQPLEIYEEEKATLKGNEDSRKGLVESDLKFLQDMPNDWNRIHIPEQRMDALTQRLPDKNAAIRELIGSVNDPIVRHRLFVFAQRITELEKKYGKPGHVALEFVREDFMGDKAKKELSQFQKRREKERNEAAKQVSELGLEEKSARLKYELLKAQGGFCLYKPENALSETSLGDYEIEHIVPRRRGGPDAMVNYVLTTRQANEEKGDRTPYEWLSATNGWDAYKNRVEEKAVKLGRKKVKLLLSADAPELVEKYTALAETAWISKLAQKILCLHFGWRNSVDEEGRKRITVISGGLTARIRRKYHLNQILAPSNATEEEAEKKNRDDDRHHALDAMVISFIPQWMRDSQKEHFFRFPVGVQENPIGFFKKHIEDVMPKNICFEKPGLAETIYGYREKEKIIVQRTELIDLAFKPVGMNKKAYDLDYLAKQAKAIRDKHIRDLILQFAQKETSEGEWLEFCKGLRLGRKDGTSEDGAKVIRVTVNVGSPEEYKDLSKDGSGAWRKGKGNHKGQFVYRDAKNKIKVRPVYVFESIKKVREELKNKEGVEKADFFQSGCIVKLSKRVEHPTTPLEEGEYKLNTIETVGRAKLTKNGKTSLPISLNKLLEAGFCRTV